MTKREVGSVAEGWMSILCYWEAAVHILDYSACLDYSNGILVGQPDYVYKRLQSVLRSAARLVLLLPCHASVTSLMRDKLHRIDFKLCLLAYKCLQSRAPQYLARHCTLMSTV